jgi:outer membrane protein TolC
MLPRLDASLSAGPIGIDTDAAPALRTLARFGGYAAQAGLLLEEPVERRAARGARDAAEGLVAKARAAERDARAQVSAATTAAVAAADATRRRADVLERAVKVAELDLEGEEARFQAGRSTNFDVLRRQQALTDVRERLLRARVDNEQAAAVLDSLTSDILVRHGLALRGSTGAP